MPAVTYPITLPTPSDIDSFAMQMWNAVAVAASPYTGQQQVYRYQGQAWRANVRLAPLPRANAEPWLGQFFGALDGAFGTFLMGDPGAGVPRGTAANSPGVPVALNGVQSGDVLTIAGAIASAANYLSVGDYVQVGSGSGAHMYKVRASVDTTSGGVASLSLWPRLRSSPGSGETVYVQSAQGVWRLASPVPEFSRGQVLYDGIVFEAVEAL